MLNEDGKASVALGQLPRSVQRNIRQISALVTQLGAEANKAGERQAEQQKNRLRLDTSK